MTLRNTLLVLVILALATTATANDGQLEINHACALTTGCFTGDTPGYPVRITQAASYRLTGNLLPGSADGIVIASGVKMVTIDLGGFRIEGGGAGTGMGIRGESGASAISVRNGSVVSMGDDGINIGGSAVLEAVHALGNGGDGFDVNQTSLVTGSRIVGNGGYGVRFSSASGLYSGNMFSGNGAGSVYLGTSGGTNWCDDGACQASIACRSKRYYLSQNVADGQGATTACATGFHMASLWEIHEPSNLEYDTGLGVTLDDSGSGPPKASFGWVRTGNDFAGIPSDYQHPGHVNCIAYTSSSASVTGTVAYLTANWKTYVTSWIGTPPPGYSVESNAMPLDPWGASVNSCDTQFSVWCVED